MGSNTLLFYKSWGEGPVVVGLPAFPFDGSMYREQLSLADQMRLLLVDYPGTRDSILAEAPVYTMDFLADCILAVMDAAQCPSAVLMGTSMGAYVAFALWQKAPSRVKGLILVDTRAEADSPDMAERRKVTVAGLRSEGSSVLRERMQALFAASTRAQQPGLVAEFQAKLAGMSAEALARLTLGLAERPDRTELLATIKVPTLVIVGEEDTVSPPEVMRTMASKISGSIFKVISGAGHLTPLEKPEVFNRLICEFVMGLR